jgi:hypothetical protein
MEQAIETFKVLSFPISILALGVSILNYRRKSGTSIRAGWCLASSRACNDRYVSEFILENLKDKAVTIYAIYLKIGLNYYLELENHEKKPLVLRAFETYRQSFGPLEFYALSTQRVGLNKLFNDDSVRKQIVLSTGDGKYHVASDIQRWNPISEFFLNHMTAVVRPVHALHKDQYLGSNVKYVVELRGADGNEEIIPIHPKDHELQVFRQFRLTPQALESREDLEKYLKRQRRFGKLSFEKLVVYDLDAWRKRAHDLYTQESLEAEHYGWWRYRVVGRLLTIFSEWKLRWENYQLRRARKMELSGEEGS